MDFQTLIHLATEVTSRAPEATVVVFGSSSAFASYPSLAEDVVQYQNTQDADFVPQPMTEALYRSLHEAMGKESAFHQAHSYYADINGPRAFECFPAGFRDRLVPLPGVANVFALEPNDMAVAKVIAGRPKDIQMLSVLLAKGYLDEATNRRQLWFMEMDDKLIVRCDQVLKAIVAAARELGYTRQCPEQPWKTLSPQS